MYNQGLLEYSNHSHSIPRVEKLHSINSKEKTFSLRRKNPQQSKHKSRIYSLKPCFMGDAKKEKWSVKKGRSKMFESFANQIHILHRNKAKMKRCLSFLLTQVRYFISLVNMGIKRSAFSAQLYMI